MKLPRYFWLDNFDLNAAVRVASHEYLADCYERFLESREQAEMQTENLRAWQWQEVFT